MMPSETEFIIMDIICTANEHPDWSKEELLSYMKELVCGMGKYE